MAQRQRFLQHVRIVPLRLFILLVAIPWLIWFAAMLRRQYLQAGPSAFEPETRQTVYALWTLLLIAVAARLPWLFHPGFPFDTGTYQAWALVLTESGLGGWPGDVYSNPSVADYPPGHMWLMSIIGTLARTLGATDGAGFIAILKLPIVLIDLAATTLLWRYLSSHLSNRLAWLLALAFALNPILLFVGVFRGQFHLLYALLGLAGLLQMRQRPWLAGSLWGAAISLHGQALVIAVAALVVLWRATGTRHAISALIAMCATWALIIAPFASGRDAGWIVELYWHSIGNHELLTANGYNLWGALGANWLGGLNDWFGWRPWLVALVTTMAVIAWILLRPQSRSEWRNIGHTAHAEQTTNAATVTLVLLALFLFGPWMHEYSFLPVVVFAALLLPHSAAFRWGWLALSGLGMLNLVHSYSQYIPKFVLQPGFAPIITVVGSGFVALFAIWFWTDRQQRRANHPAPPSARHHHCASFPPTPLHQHDAVLLPLATVAALCLLCWRLGDLDYPTDAYQANPAGETITVTNNENNPINALYVMPGWGKTTLVVNEQTFEFDGFHAPKRLALEPALTEATFDLHIKGRGELLELALLDEENKLLQIKNVSPAGQALFNEQANVHLGRGHLATSYFDEIYFARSAYEMRHGLPIYETTHPGFGKWLLGLGTDWLGVTPFGWRLMPALFGALFVPVMFWAGWVFTRQRAGAWLAAGLIVIDGLVFSVSRYATPDGPLAWLLLVAFVAVAHDHRTSGGRFSAATLRWWLLAGICIGAAAALKWNALFCGAAIGALLLHGLWQRRERIAQAAGWSVAGVACFAVLPALIYAAAHWPIFATRQPPITPWSANGIEALLAHLRFGLSYHTGLADTHWFSSPFWSWPISWQPVWLYDAANLPDGIRERINLVGNPMVWWAGAACLLALFWQSLRHINWQVMFILAGFAAMWLPWLVIERIAFLYHYLPCVPLMVLAICLQISRTEKLARNAWIFFGIASGVFLLFLPTFAGLPVADWYVRLLHWLPPWWSL